MNLYQELKHIFTITNTFCKPEKSSHMKDGNKNQ